MVSGRRRDMCESMTIAEPEHLPEPKATPWPTEQRRKVKVEWPPEQDEATWDPNKEAVDCEE